MGKLKMLNFNIIFEIEKKNFFYSLYLKKKNWCLDFENRWMCGERGDGKQKETRRYCS